MNLHRNNSFVNWTQLPWLLVPHGAFWLLVPHGAIGGRKGGTRGLKPSLFLVSLRRIVIFSIQMCPENLNSPQF